MQILFHCCLRVCATPSPSLCCTELSHSPDSLGTSRHPAQREDQSCDTKREARTRLPWGGRSAQPQHSNMGVKFMLHHARLERGKIIPYILLGSLSLFLTAQLLHKPNQTFLEILLVTAVTCPAWL